MTPLLLVALVCALLSLVTYLVYALDKSAARRRRHRVPERTLHLLSLLGGWPGALLAQYTLRHKTAKPRFLFVFWLTVLGHVGTVTALLVRS